MTGILAGGSITGAKRWWVTREYLRSTRFGEPGTAGVVWAVTPVLGRGPQRRPVGGPTYFASRGKALAFAHAQAARASRTPRNRKATS